MRKILAGVLAGALLFGACGGDSASENPKQALTSALDELGDREALSVTFSLQSDVDSLVAAGEGDLKAEDAQKILDSSITIAGNQAEDPEDARALVSADIAGLDNALEIRVIGTTLFVRADAKGLAEAFGQDPAQLDAFAQQASAGGLGFLTAAVNGEWISLTGFDQLAEQFGGTAQPSEADQKLIEDFANTLKENTSVTSEGSDDAGEHLVASIPLRDAYENFVETAGQLSGSVPMGELPPASEVPDKDVTVDLWVKDGKLTQVELDFIGIAREFESEEIPEGVESLGLRMTIEDFSGEVEEPSGATEVDLNELMGMFLGGVGGTGGGGGGELDICAQLEPALEGAPQDVLDQLEAQYGDQCPELFK